MTDHHVHIGQFNEIYYDAFEVFSAIEKIGIEFNIKEIHYSSTSSCRNDVCLQKVEEEINYAQKFFSSNIQYKPYLWFTTNYSDQNISVTSALQNTDYCGIKLHPLAHKWDFTNPKHLITLDQIFSWSDETHKPILIHSGTAKGSLPNYFERYFKNFPNSQIILAHSNPVDMTIQLLEKYSNLKCDIACANYDTINKLTEHFKNKDRIFFGSDFPITHYLTTQRDNPNMNLEEQYKKDCRSSLFLK